MTQDEENKADETSFENQRSGTADAPPVAADTSHAVDPVAAAMADPQVSHAGVRPSTPRDQEFFAGGEGPREVPEEAFHVPVSDVLKGAEEEEFSAVAVVGLNHEGRVVVAGSHGGPMVKDLLAQGQEAIDWLVENEDAEEDMPARPGPLRDFIESGQDASDDDCE